MNARSFIDNLFDLLFESKIYDIYDDMTGNGDIWYEAMSAKPGEHQPWKLVPAKPMIRIWKEYGRSGRIRDPAELDYALDLTMENIIKICINSEIRNNGPQIEDEKGNPVDYHSIPDTDWDKFYNYISDQSKSGYGRMADMGTGGHCRFSDGSAYLHRLLTPLEAAKTDEEKLLALDKAWNVIHGIGAMAYWFIEGGPRTLDAIRDTGWDADLYAKEPA